MSRHARDESDEVVKFLSEMLAAVKPEAKGRDVSVREVLDDAARTIGERFHDRPLIEARLHRTIGDSYYALGLYDAAESHQTAAAAILRRELGADNPETLDCINALTNTLLARGDYSGAAASYRTT